MSDFLKIWIVICTTISLCKAQATKDFGSWNTFSVEYKASDKVNLVFDQEVRFNENLTRLNQFFTEFGAELKLPGKIKTSLTFRTTQRLQPENYFSYRHRLTWDINVKKNIHAFTFLYRHRLQCGLRNYYSSPLGKIPSLYERHKLQIKYEVNKRIEPYFSTEIRFQLKDPRNMFHNNEFNWIRFKFGSDFKLSSNKSVGLYYLIQNELDIIDQQDIYVIGLEYSLKF